MDRHSTCHQVRLRFDSPLNSPPIELTLFCLFSCFFTECQQVSSNSPCYSSGPNDVWSLGIILVNLTCGRNPWKRASIEDSTFRAYLKNPKFLSSILPLSPELDAILRRIFECDPRRRICIRELRNLILRCPCFTTRSAVSSPPPPPEVKYPHEGLMESRSHAAVPFHQYPAVPYTPASSPPISPTTAHFSQPTISSGGSTASDGESTFSVSPSSSVSLSYEQLEDQSQQSAYVPPKSPFNYYGSFIPLDPNPKILDPQPCFHTVQVC